MKAKAVRLMEARPGLTPVIWRGGSWSYAVLAWLAAVAWPPLAISLVIFPPHDLVPWGGADWRLFAILGAALGVPLTLRLVDEERRRNGVPASRLAILWRFVLYGLVGTVGFELLGALVSVAAGWHFDRPLAQQIASAQTALLIYGVGLMPFGAAIGVSYAAWAGLMVAFIAFEKKPPKVRDRLGLIDR